MLQVLQSLRLRNSSQIRPHNLSDFQQVCIIGQMSADRVHYQKQIIYLPKIDFENTSGVNIKVTAVDISYIEIPSPENNLDNY